jgi:hypothetical protein
MLDMTTRHTHRGLTRNIRVVISALVFCLLGSSLNSLAFAQSSGTNKDRERIDNLLQSLIELELQRRELDRIERTRPAPRPLSNAPDQNLDQVRNLLDKFSKDTSILIYEIDDAGAKIPTLRNHLTSALKVRARAGVLAERSQQTDDLAEIVRQFEGLDRDWRSLSYNLKRMKDLPDSSKRQLATLNSYDAQLCELLKVKPQLNRHELLRQALALSADLSNLVEDIEVELGSTDRTRRILLSSHKTQQQANQLSLIVTGQSTEDAIVSEYQTFRKLWQPLAAALRTVENRYIERSIRRIRSTDHSLAALLWIDRQVDNQQLIDIAATLTKDTDEFFARTSLKLLIELPNQDEIIPIADEFYGVLQNFSDIVDRNEPHSAVVDAWQFVDKSSQQFLAAYSQLKSQSALSVLSDIEHTLTALRQSLQLGTDDHFKPAIDLAANLEILADHLDIDTNRWLNRKSEPFRTEALKETAAFADATHHIHEGLISRVDKTQLQTETVSLFATWRRVYNHISKCNTSDRAHLARTATKITPLLIELRTLLEE